MQHFDLDEKDAMRKVMQGQWDLMKLRAKKNGQVLIFESQKRTGDDITDKFVEDKCTAITMCAPCQWGKTGAMLQVIVNLSTHDELIKLIPYTNIFIITGISDLEWKKQTVARFPECMRDNILHLPDLTRVLPKRMHKCRDALFIIDECHIANASNQSISNAFQACGIANIQYMKDNNIKILQVSATPDNAAHDMRSWGEDHQMYVPEIPESYVSFEKLFDWHRVYNKLDLRKDDEIKIFFDLIVTKFKTPKFHILRVNARHDIHAHIREYAENYGVILMNHDCSVRIENVEELLSSAPTKHTLIIIKQMWKAAKTLEDTHIGIVHESVANSKNFSTEVQGLCGRLCGHGKIMGFVGPLLFCDTTILRNYIDLLDCNFNYKQVVWRSDRIKSDGFGKVEYTMNWSNPVVVGGVIPVLATPKRGKHYKYKTCRVSPEDLDWTGSLQEFLSVVKEHWNLKSNVKFDEKNQQNGFYMCSVTGGSRVWTTEDLLNSFKNFSPISNFGVNLKSCNYIIPAGKRFTRMYVCYKDLTPESRKNPIIYARIFTAIKDCDFSDVPKE